MVCRCIIFCSANMSPEWRNWQTRRTQNPVRVTPSVGSSPTSGTEKAAERCLLFFKGRHRVWVPCLPTASAVRQGVPPPARKRQPRAAFCLLKGDTECVFAPCLKVSIQQAYCFLLKSVIKTENRCVEKKASLPADCVSSQAGLSYA